MRYLWMLNGVLRLHSPVETELNQGQKQSTKQLILVLNRLLPMIFSNHSQIQNIVCRLFLFWDKKNLIWIHNAAVRIKWNNTNMVLAGVSLLDLSLLEMLLWESNEEKKTTGQIHYIKKRIVIVTHVKIEVIKM